ncbi:hypothetical protein [Aequorivita lipolytica]|uniref:Uncharacterized protein n=1 Tax=Aequorivita lipolytica TaxID=153267 RepID=A0A5C6YM75_9FLAO|nr:hypothetical protein [Aequorivita lipolytica]TXD68348.1 hypothetical protein ESV24_12870 [Aequorivita lipolytica]SRX53377.1 hypothetical protein AEQU2_02607 [Aequorivita lipolytica]
MKRFNFEKNLLHQTQAVNITVSVFNNLDIAQAKGVDQQFLHPVNDFETGFGYITNIRNILERNGFDEKRNGRSNIINIMMETGTGTGTGTGKTFTKTIYARLIIKQTI